MDTNPQYLQAKPNKDGGPSTPSTPSRTRSLLNLTSSTLFGIYSETGPHEREEISKNNKDFKEALERDRETILQQEEYNRELMLELKHFADVSGRYAKEVEDLKDNLRQCLADLTNKNLHRLND